jgi:Ca-activated chloride channel family protein
MNKGYALTTRCLTAAFFLLGLPDTMVGSQDHSPSRSRYGDHFTITVDVDVVVLYASVRTRKGVLVSGLDRDSFRIYEDGVLQEIRHFSSEDTPVTVGLVVDNSGSMRPKRPDAIAAVLAFASSSNKEDQMFTVSFNEDVSFGLPPHKPFTDTKAELAVALSQVAADGMTALYDAMVAALEHLKKGVRDKKVLLVISDGGDNASRHNLAEVMALAGQPAVIIYTVGLFDSEDPDRNPGVLKQLAEATGGEAFFPGSVQGVAPICEQIARDIHTQYTLAYVPTNRSKDGTYRVLEVRAKGSHRQPLSVRTRAGYYAPLEPQPLTAGGTEHEPPN